MMDRGHPPPTPHTRPPGPHPQPVSVSTCWPAQTQTPLSEVTLAGALPLAAGLIITSSDTHTHTHGGPLSPPIGSGRGDSKLERCCMFVEVMLVAVEETESLASDMNSATRLHHSNPYWAQPG